MPGTARRTRCDCDQRRTISVVPFRTPYIAAQIVTGVISRDGGRAHAEAACRPACRNGDAGRRRLRGCCVRARQRDNRTARWSGALECDVAACRGAAGHRVGRQGERLHPDRTHDHGVRLIARTPQILGQLQDRLYRSPSSWSPMGMTRSARNPAFGSTAPSCSRSTFTGTICVIMPPRGGRRRYPHHPIDARSLRHQDHATLQVNELITVECRRSGSQLPLDGRSGRPVRRLVQPLIRDDRLMRIDSGTLLRQAIRFQTGYQGAPSARRSTP